MILITGASGNAGREVLREAIARGLRVRAAFQTKEKAAEAPDEVETAIVDFNQPATMRAALDRIQSVFLAGPLSPGLLDMERKAVDEIRRTNARLLVKLSAMGPRNLRFPGQHRESEDYIQTSGMAYTILRPNWFMQNMVIYDRSSIASQGAFYGAQGEGPVSHVDLRGVAAVAVEALTNQGHNGKAHTLTGPEALTNAHIAEMLSSVLGRSVQ